MGSTRANQAKQGSKLSRRTVAEKYIADVLAGRVQVSKLVRLQIERHQRDLKEGKARGLTFDREAAQHVIDFFPLFACGVDGDYFGVPLELDPAWQALLWILYGWKRRNEKGRKLRRFKIAYSEMGAGNLKSLILSGLCLYELYAFGERGARVYAAATDRKTARRVFDTASTMAMQSDYLRDHLLIGKEAIADPVTDSKFEAVASEDQNLQGLRPSFVCIDELHAHSSDGVWNAFYSRLGKTTQPLIFAITNSGFDRNSVCYKQREYSEKVLNGIIPDDTWFSWICGLDPEDIEDLEGWEDESKWPKANPCWGTAVRLAEMREQANKAKGDPSSLNTFLRFRLCVWTTNLSAWLRMDKWDACAAAVDLETLKGRRCFGGLDLSTTTDISAFVLVFEPTLDDPRWIVLPFFFLPKDNIVWRCRKDRVPYDVWAREGLFNLTEGCVIDYEFIRAKINQLRDEFQIVQIAFDRWNSTDIVTKLISDGHEMVRVGQGFAGMAAPTKRLEEVVLGCQLAHGGNPVLRWMASNVIVEEDPAGNKKPNKAKSREKIDGIVALAMAITGLMTVPDSTPGCFVA
jgi:phage terminase large subunit-like protein